MASYVPLISDEPCVEIAQLPERRRLIEQIAHAVAYSEPPLVVGVHGDWGSGKTSFLHALQYHLTGRCPQNPGAAKSGKAHQPHIAAVWFEAWRYQHETLPLIALLHEIRNQLTYSAFPAKHVLARVKKLGFVAVDGALRTFDSAIGAVAAHFSGLPLDPRVKIGVVEGVRAAGEAYENDTLATRLPSQHIREHLKNAVANLLPTPFAKDPEGRRLAPRLIVFIDDLDRCEADATLRLLEGIKVYLNLPNCVFVLGLNQREVERALAKVMPSGRKDAAEDSAGLTVRAQEYLEKICANVWHLPPPTSAEQVALLRSWLQTPEKKLADDFTDALLALVEKYDFLPANTRRLKAYANGLVRLCRRRAASLTEPATIPLTDAPVAAIVAYFQQFHPRLWRLIETEPLFYEELRANVGGTTPKARVLQNTERSEQDRHPAIDELELPFYAASLAASSGVAAPKSRFADRSYGHVLHAQRLIADTPIPTDKLAEWAGRA